MPTFNEVEFREVKLLMGDDGAAGIVFLTSGPTLGFQLSFEIIQAIREELDKAQLFLTPPTGTT